MRKMLALLFTLSLMILLASCGQQGQAPFKAGDAEYTFFASLSDSLELPEIHPDNAEPLIKTTRFTITTWDMLPFVYLQLRQFEGNISRLTKDQVKDAFVRNAQNESKKRLLLEVAKGGKFNVPKDTVDSELQKIYARYGSEEGFYEQMAKNGFDKKKILQDVKENLRIRAYLDYYLENEIEVSEDQIQQLYGSDKSATVRHILFMTQGKSEKDKEAVRKKADGILKRARNGEDFAELAKEFTEDPGSKDNGGLYENFPRGQMVPPFDEASFTLPIGSISDLVETRYGFHIIKVVSREAETRPLEEIRGELRRKIAQQQNPNFMAEMLASLEEEYKMEVVIK